MVEVLVDGIRQREESRCNNQPDKKRKINRTRDHGAMKSGGRALEDWRRQREEKQHDNQPDKRHKSSRLRVDGTTRSRG